MDARASVAVAVAEPALDAPAPALRAGYLVTDALAGDMLLTACPSLDGLCACGSDAMLCYRSRYR